ncbi:MAG: fibrinogen-like YCDxxxxGGGW domain-containing protein [Oligoflexus sp.]|jgi:hypothetical protein
MQKRVVFAPLSAILGLLISCRPAGDETIPDIYQYQSDHQSGDAEAGPDESPAIETYEGIIKPDPAPLPAAAPVAPSSSPFYPADCAAIRKARPELPNGVYKIYLNPDQASRVPIDAYCDLASDGGGWTLVLNYVHRGNTNPPLGVRSTSLPILGSDQLGMDESAQTTFWGHAGAALLARFAIKELRFYCRSSQNSRIVHFKTAEAGCIMAARTGGGTCLNIRNAFTPLVGHTANLPATIDRADTNRLDEVLTYNTFGRVDPNLPDPMWNVRGDTGMNSWECDFGSNNPNFDTIHRIWFR